MLAFIVMALVSQRERFSWLDQDLCVSGNRGCFAVTHYTRIEILEKHAMGRALIPQMLLDSVFDLAIYMAGYLKV